MLQNNFDIHEWRLYQSNLNLLNEQDEDDDFNINVGDGWEFEELGIGDTITHEMWKDPEWNYFTKRGNVKIEDIGDEDGVKYVILTDFKEEDNWEEYDLNYINNMLEYPYQIFLPMNEQEKDDDFNITVDDEWGVNELTVGDVITPDMWKNPEWDYFAKGNVKITDISTDDDDGHTYIILTNIKDEHTWEEYLFYVNNMLKYPYRIIKPLTEQDEDDDFNINIDDKWNVEELGVGNTITPNMWNKNLDPEYNDINDWIDNPNENQIIDDVYTSDSGGVAVVFTGKKSNIQNVYTLTDFNNLLDPKFQVILPLNEQDDDWDIKLDNPWGGLEVGDTITPEMWDQDKIDNDRKVSDKDWFKKPHEITNFRSTYMELIKFDYHGKELSKYFVNKYLKPQYQIVLSLKEQNKDDDFNINVDDKWNVEELGVGDYITFDMLNSKAMDDWNEFQEYFPFKIERERHGNWFIVTKTGTGTYYSSDTLNNILKSKFKVIASINEQDEDEDWNITVDYNWDLSFEEEEILKYYEDDWEKIDGNLVIKSNLDLSNTPITLLPNNLKVGGNLYLYKAKITSLPDNLKVGGNLHLYNTPITSLPDDLKVGGYLNLENTKITSLPNNLKVGDNLYLNNTLITSLPNNLQVGGNLHLSNTKITSLPNDLKVGGDIIGLKPSLNELLDSGLKIIDVKFFG
jgi:hypothetical protein